MRSITIYKIRNRWSWIQGVGRRQIPQQPVGCEDFVKSQNAEDSSIYFLSGHATGSVTLHQILNLGNAHLVIVSENGMLEAGSSHRKIQSLLVVIGICQQTINQSAHKRVTSTNSVHDMGNVITR